MIRWFRIIIKTLITLLTFLVLFILGMAWYVNTHKKELLGELISGVNSKINGTLTVDEMKPAFFSGFSGFSVALKNVTLRDTLYTITQKDLLHAKEIYISFNIISVLKRKPEVSKIGITDGSIYIAGDSLGNNNLVGLWKNKQASPFIIQPRIKEISIESVSVVIENTYRSNFFSLDIKKLTAKLSEKDSVLFFNSRIDIRTKDVMFNTLHGSYLKDKDISGELDLKYDTLTKLVSLKPYQDIKIDGNEVKLTASIHFCNKPADFAINFKSDKILFKDAVSWLPPNISVRLKPISIEQPVSLNSEIRGKVQFRDTPLIIVDCQAPKNSLKTPNATIENCSFDCSFRNWADTTKGPGDQNSIIVVHRLKGSWMTIPFEADSLQVLNLVKPVLTGRFSAKCPAKKLNTLFESDKFLFENGEASLDIHYHGAIDIEDTTDASIDGFADIKNADITYLPKAIPFSNSNLSLVFSGHDVFFKDVRLQSGNNILQMEGSLLNFTDLYYKNPDNLLFEWKIKSSKLYLDQFLVLMDKIKPKNTGPDTLPGNKIMLMARQMEQLLEMGNIHMSLNVDQLIYKSFIANDISASLLLSKELIEVENAQVNIAGGKLTLKGTLDQKFDTPVIKTGIKIDKVNVKDLFRAFNNFGQLVLTDKNLAGLLSANAVLKGKMTENAEVIPESVIGNVSFNLKQASLTGFDPLKKIGGKIFRNRDLENVQVSELNNNFDIQGDKIILKPLHIETNALTINVDGVFGIRNGTDLNIDVPLRNPIKDEAILNDSLRMYRSGKGITVHFKATDDPVTGKLKIDWYLRSKTENKTTEDDKKKWWKPRTWLGKRKKKDD